MLQLVLQDNFNSIISLSKELCLQANGMEPDDLKKKISEYNEKIEEHFRLCKTEDLSELVKDELSQLIRTHEKMIDFFNEEKEKISKSIKQLHAGKKMQNTYS
jgi:hypothetical protein